MVRGSLPPGYRLTFPTSLPANRFNLFRSYRPREKLFGRVPGPSGRAITWPAFSRRLSSLRSSFVTWIKQKICEIKKAIRGRIFPFRHLMSGENIPGGAALLHKCPYLLRFRRFYFEAAEGIIGEAGLRLLVWPPNPAACAGRRYGCSSNIGLRYRPGRRGPRRRRAAARGTCLHPSNHRQWPG